jgi:hypothetical protein
VQLGTDRVVAFAFGSGEGRCFVILELYAGGNIILTDQDFRILSLLRTHDYDDSVRVAVKQIYPFAAATKSMPELGTAPAAPDAASSDASAVVGEAVADAPIELTLDSVSVQIQTLLDDVGARAMEGKERKKSTLKNVLSQRRSGVSDFGCAPVHRLACRPPAFARVGTECPREMRDSLCLVIAVERCCHVHQANAAGARGREGRPESGHDRHQGLGASYPRPAGSLVPRDAEADAVPGVHPLAICAGVCYRNGQDRTEWTSGRAEGCSA